MKKIRFYLSRMMLVFAFGLIPYYSVAQDVKPGKQEKKAIEQAELTANFNAIDTLLDRKTFVLEADYLQDKYGSRVPVTSLLNFIKVDSMRVVLQTGSNFTSGYNGVGGVTAEGFVESYKVLKNPKNLTYTVSFSVMTNVGIYDILMNISSDGNARATITGLSGGKLSWDGHFQNLYNSRFFKGQETF